MLHTVHLALTTHETTNYPLFPSGETVIEGWNEEMAARLLPIAMFDSKMAGEEVNDKVFFLYYDDYSETYLNWKTSNGKIVEINDWQKIRPFAEKPDIEKIKAELGAYLKFESYPIEVDLPSKYDYVNTWNGHFSTALEQAGAKNALSRIRVGGGYPCYVQGILTYDDPGFIGELPTSYYDLSPMYFYLSTDGNGGYFQEMQMT